MHFSLLLLMLLFVIVVASDPLLPDVVLDNE